MAAAEQAREAASHSTDGLLQRRPGEAQAAFHRDRTGLFLQCAHGGLATAIDGMADVEGQRDLAGDDVGGAGRDGHLADRGDHAAALGGQNELGGAAQGVVAQVHRRRAGVAGAAVQVYAQRLWPAMAVTTPSGRPRGFEHRSLFDVRLDIRQQFAATPACARDAFLLDACKLARRERAGHRAAAEIDRLVAHALFIAEATTSI